MTKALTDPFVKDAGYKMKARRPKWCEITVISCEDIVRRQSEREPEKDDANWRMGRWRIGNIGSGGICLGKIPFLTLIPYRCFSLAKSWKRRAREMTRREMIEALENSNKASSWKLFMWIEVNFLKIIKIRKIPHIFVVLRKSPSLPFLRLCLRGWRERSQEL